MSTSTRRSFPANHAGVCGTCPAPIAVGDHVFYATPGAALVSGVDCCADRGDDELTAYQLPGDDTTDDDSPADNIAKVLPRRPAKACPTCWQIPASNGTCGCDY